MRNAMIALLFGGYCMTARSDEGMWLLNDPPRGILKEKYQFDLSDAWLDRAMKASVRFNNGGSGGFVSDRGLIVTNHHIAADALQKLSTKDRDLYKNGFQARKPEDELKCPDLELNVLQEIEDVTAKVNAAVKEGMKPAEAAAARKAVMSQIEKDSLERTKLRSDVVTLYQGGLYHLYRYKKYTDVRLVFSPEGGIAFFGGDTDNFEYPRYNLDVAFFRAYEDGKPVASKHFFQWSTVGPKEGDLAFVVGHPGTTNRLETYEKLLHRRDHSHPYALARLRAMEAALEQYAARGPEEKRQAATDIHRVANARKAISGQYQGLLDINLIAEKAEKDGESKPQEFLVPREPQSAKYDPWEAIAIMQHRLTEYEKELNLIERGDGFTSELFSIARHLVRMADELPKPSGERLREYRDSNLESLKYALFSPAPIEAGLERAKLTCSLTIMAEMLGGSHDMVSLTLDRMNPAARAEVLVKSKLYDVAERKKLLDGGKVAIDASTDPMIVLARKIDRDARKLRRKYENEVEEPERQAYAEIAKYRFAKYGKSIAPDATFTLRLAFGTVRGYEVEGTALPFATDFAGAFAKADRFSNKEPNELPKSWLNAKEKLNMTTPFNFVSTADTIGGNSGSPVLNRAGELIGINFDRNRHGLVRNFVYTDVQARHIAVHGQAVLEVLDKVYDAKQLKAELLGK